MLSAEQILKIPLSNPELLFPEKETKAIKAFFRDLVKVWHPDVSLATEAEEVFKHINMLYKKATYKSMTDTWDSYGRETITTVGGKTYRFKYQYMFKNSFSINFVGHSRSIWRFDKCHAEHFLRAVETLKGLKFSSKRMEKGVGAYLPTYDTYETDRYYVLAVHKTKDQVPLKALLKYYKGIIDPKHVAWMISSILNLTCYLKWAGLTHNDISIDTCFVSPEHHSISLFGGWGFACKVGDKLKAMPKRTYQLTPASVKANKLAAHIVDTQLVRALGRELLGNASGSSLYKNKDVPEVFVNWFMLPGSDDPMKDYEVWMKKILPAAYGKRRFIKMDARNDIQEIYNSNR